MPAGHVPGKSAESNVIVSAIFLGHSYNEYLDPTTSPLLQVFKIFPHDLVIEAFLDARL